MDIVVKQDSVSKGIVGPDGKAIKMPYKGTRTSYRCYHPSVNWNLETAWVEAKKEFMRLYNTWIDVCELYQDEMRLSEPVVSNEVRKDIFKLVDEIEKDRNYRCYVIEALSEALWEKPSHDEEDYDGTGRKCETHYFPTMKELRDKADEFRAMDIGLSVASDFHPIVPVQRSWGS